MEKKISLQDIFDKAWEHFILNDGKLSVLPNGRCKYRDLDGNKCAIGCALTNTQAEYADNLIQSGFDRLVLAKSEWFDEDIVSMPGWKLIDFQSSLHDDFVGQEVAFNDKIALIRQYISVANRFNLKIPGETTNV